MLRFLRVVVAADEDNLRFRSELAYLVSCFDAIHFRHHDIEDNYVGFEFARTLDGRLAVFSFVDLPMGLPGQKRAQGTKHVRLVIDYKDFRGYRHGSRAGSWEGTTRCPSRI